MGFVGSVLFGVLAVLAADVTHQSRAGLAATWVLGVLALMCSGIGVVMVAVAAITAFLRRGLRAALLLALVPAVVFTAWYAVYGKSAASPTPRSIGTLLAIPEYTAIGLTSALTNFVGIPAGTIIAVALAAWLLRSGRTAGTSRAIAFAGSCGAIALFVFIGVGRSGFGVEEAAAARYAYIAIGLLLPALALLASWAAAATPWPTMVTVFVGVVLCMHNLSDLRAAVATERAREGVIRSHVLAAADIVASGGTRPPTATRPVPESGHHDGSAGTVPRAGLAPGRRRHLRCQGHARRQGSGAGRTDPGNRKRAASPPRWSTSPRHVHGKRHVLGDRSHGDSPNVLLDLDPERGGQLSLTPSADGVVGRPRCGFRPVTRGRLSDLPGGSRPTLTAAGGRPGRRRRGDAARHAGDALSRVTRGSTLACSGRRQSP